MAVLLLTGTARALPPAPTSLNTCQNTVKAEAAKFSKKKILAIATCLKKVSSDIIKSNVSITTTTAKLCLSQFRKIFDSRPGHSLKDKMDQKINKKCTPGMLATVTHTLADVLGPGHTVPESTEATNLNVWCQQFGGDGSIDDVSEWVKCIANSHECAADLAISMQYPRALEWFDLVKVAITALPSTVSPASDPTRKADALAALNTVDTTIDGVDDDDVPSMQCGQAVIVPPACSTACCYAKFSLGPDASCSQYRGTTAQVAAFTASCGGSSSPFGSWSFVAAAGPCTAAPAGGPAGGTTCAVGMGTNAMLIPTESTCP